MWGKMNPDEILTEHVVDITESRRMSVKLLKEIRLHLLKHMALTNTLLNHLCRRGSAFTTGTLGPDEARQMVTRNKLQESGISLHYKMLLNMSNTKSFTNVVT